MARKIFVNLPVRDLQQSMAFFARLGFTFNPQFTDDKAACMVVSDEAFVMLLTAPFFETFTNKPLVDARERTEMLACLSCASRAEVDQLVHEALAAGASRARDPIDYGFMYGWSFYDLDGHHWELMWMDPGHIRK